MPDTLRGRIPARRGPIRRNRHAGAAAGLAALFFAAGLPTVRAQTATPAPPLAVPIASAATQRITRHIARGVDLIQEITPDGDPAGPLLVTVIVIDPKVPGVRIEAALGQDKVWGTDPTFGREIVSRLVTRHRAVAGVNAGFFPFAGNPIGLHIGGGDLVTEPTVKQHRTSFYISRDGQSGFAVFNYAGTATALGAPSLPPHAIDGLNRKPAGEKDAAGELLLFTPVWSPRTLSTAGRAEVILTGVPTPLAANQDYLGTVAGPATIGGNTPVAPGTVVLSGVGPGADFLTAAAAAPGAQIKFRIGVTAADGPAAAPDPSDFAEAVTGGPRILTNGQITDQWQAEGMGRSFSTTSHPRTAIGRTADGKILLLTVDGRQKGISHGAPLPNLAALLLRFGATDGLNLDGGGSSTAVVWDGVANSPSEGVERPVADALLVYASDLPAPPKTAAAAAKLKAPDRPLVVGQSWDFSAGPASLAGDDSAVWTVRGGIGYVTQNGVFHALRPGKGAVSVTSGSRSRTLRAPITVVGVGHSDAAGFQAKLTLLPDPEGSPLKSIVQIHIANAEGDPLATEPVAITITGGVPDAPTSVTDSHGDARVGVTWGAPGAPRRVTVISPQKRFASSTVTQAAPDSARQP